MTWLLIETVTRTGRAATVEVAIRRDTVEMWSDGHCAAVVDRDELRAWLAHPVRVMVIDDVMLAPVEAGLVTLVVGAAVGPWTLAPHVFEDLRGRV